MWFQRLINNGGVPVLEQVTRFTAARHRLLAENIANISTPEYRQKDLSIQKFQSALAEGLDRRRRDRTAGIGDAVPEPEESGGGILFHDGNNRSMEQLAGDLAKNALMHNIAVELLRKQFAGMELALKERVV